MALPTSGPLSMSAIRTELVNGGLGENIPSTAYGLRLLSSTAGKSTPDGIDEFYGYSAGGGTVTYTASWSTGTKYGSGAYNKPIMQILVNGSLVVERYATTDSGTFTFTSGSSIELYSSVVREGYSIRIAHQIINGIMYLVDDISEGYDAVELWNVTPSGVTSNVSISIFFS